MTLTKEILRITARYHPVGYAQLYHYLYEETIYGKKLNKRSLSTILSRMKKDGLLKDSPSTLSPTQDGKVLLERMGNGIRTFFNQHKIVDNRAKEKRLIVIFDIPEKKKGYREWLRMELVGFGFNLVQKSVWFGPTLPKEFLEYLEEIKLLKHIRFFRATEKDLI